MKKIFNIFLAFLFLITSCSNNILNSMASKSSDDYYFEEAEKANNARDFDSAILFLTQSLSTAAQATVRAKELLSSAYAGKCGLNFVEYTTNLSDSASGGVFSFLSQPFVGITVSPSHCILALQTLDSIGTPAERDLNQNTFAAITSLVLMGSAVRGYTDKTPDVGDGTTDVNICSTMTNAEVEDVVIGFAYFAQNLAYVSADLIGGGALNSLNGIVSVCSAVPGANCTTTDRADINSVTKDTIRDFLNTQQYGVGSYDTGGNDLTLPLACP